MYNRVILIGRLTRDPELKYTQGGSPVARFSLAVDRGRKNQQGEKETDFIRCSTWNKQAELVANYLQKGRLVAVEGSLRIDDVEQQDGQRRQYVEVVCNSVRFLDKGKDQMSGSGGDFTSFGQEVDPHSDDVPF
jgi:single-strand DNA-binding protein